MLQIMQTFNLFERFVSLCEPDGATQFLVPEATSPQDNHRFKLSGSMTCGYKTQIRPLLLAIIK